MSDDTNALTEALLTNDPLAEAISTATTSTQQTARKAAMILEVKGIGYKVPNAKHKRILLVEFAKRNLVIYGKAFDIINTTSTIDLGNPNDVAKNLDKITLYEIKSTNKTLGSDFSKYFFALTTAELLVAQNLKNRYKFVFVNTVTGEHLELTLSEIFSRAKGIYPTWSIMF